MHEARRLLSEDYHQVSRAYCRLARAPVGLSPEQALGRVLGAPVPTATKSRTLAGRLYLRKHAPAELCITVSSEVMREFRRLGGGPYAAKEHLGTSDGAA